MNEHIRALQALMERQGYVADPAVATAVYLAKEMRKPLLIEGEAGVGKTELAKVLARVLSTELIRLQCYEGLDTNTALYEWNYQRQLLRLRIAEREAHDPAALEDLIFAREYLLERPLLKAITRRDGPPVLLIDEIDRADDAFEAFLLEILSDFQITIPELGTIQAQHVPIVVLTSNRTRELGDALRRRCLYLYMEHPSLEKELQILRVKVPDLDQHLAQAIAGFVQRLRTRDLRKLPGIAETIDWARALVRLHYASLDAEVVRATLGCLLKDEHDLRQTGEEAVAELLAYASASTDDGGLPRRSTPPRYSSPAALREQAIRVGLGDELDAARALTLVDLLDRREVREGLRIAFKVPHEARATFDRLFEAHWGGEVVPQRPAPGQELPRDHRGAPRNGAWTESRCGSRPERSPAGCRRGLAGLQSRGAAAPQALRRAVSPRARQLERLLARLAVRLATRRGRRLVPAHGRGMVDLRRSFREALGTRASCSIWPVATAHWSMPRLVLLYDTSGSMDPYTRVLLAFALALRRVMKRVEVFTFNTALTRVTGLMAPTRIQQTLERLAAGVPDWSGGTRIGACLAEFVACYRTRMVDPRHDRRAGQRRPRPRRYAAAGRRDAGAARPRGPDRLAQSAHGRRALSAHRGRDERRAAVRGPFRIGAQPRVAGALAAVREVIVCVRTRQETVSIG